MIPARHIIYGHFIGQPILADELFCDLLVETKISLSLIRQRKKINKGKIITKVGVCPKNIYVLLNGQAQLTFKNNLSQKNIVRLIENNEIIGLTQLISNSANEMSVVTIAPCVFDIFPTRNFLKLLENEPQLCFRLANCLSFDIQCGYKSFISSVF